MLELALEASVSAWTGWGQVTGGWSNLLQGAIGGLLGTLVGVTGAFLIARSTTRAELRRDRRLVREAAGLEAASEIAPALRHMAENLEAADIRYGEAVRHPAVASMLRDWWQHDRTELEEQVEQGGLYLPRELSARLAVLLPMLGIAYKSTWEDPMAVEPSSVLPNLGPEYNDLREQIAAARTAVERYRNSVVARE